MVGLGAVAGCRLQGAERIVCVDLSEDRLELARGQGATDMLVGGEDAVERILEMTGGFGADYTFEATGNVAVMRQAVEAARMGWGLCTVAGVAGKGETLDIVPRFLITGRRVSGSSFGGVKGREQVPQLVERYLAGEIDVEPVHLAPHRARRGQPRLRADGGPGRHPQRHRPRSGIGFRCEGGGDLRERRAGRAALRGRPRSGLPRGLRDGDVEAISIEGGDLLARAVSPPASTPHIVGYLCAGTVVEVGAGVEGPAVGEKVVALNANGSHAEKRVVPAMMTWPIPDGLDPAVAACIPVALGTAHECLFTAADLERGRRC